MIINRYYYTLITNNDKNNVIWVLVETDQWERTES